MINTNTDEDEKYLRLKEVGEKIVKRRKELNMTATELAIQADITASSLSLYETGQREMRIDTFYKISAALKVPFSYFQAKEFYYVIWWKTLIILFYYVEGLTPVDLQKISLPQQERASEAQLLEDNNLDLVESESGH